MNTFLSVAKTSLSRAHASLEARARPQHRVRDDEFVMVQAESTPAEEDFEFVDATVTRSGNADGSGGARSSENARALHGARASRGPQNSGSARSSASAERDGFEPQTVHARSDGASSLGGSIASVPSHPPMPEAPNGATFDQRSARARAMTKGHTLHYEDNAFSPQRLTRTASLPVCPMPAGPVATQLGLRGAVGYRRTTRSLEMPPESVARSRLDSPVD